MEVTFGQMGDLGQSGCFTLISRFHKTTQDKHWLDSHQKLHIMSSPQWEADRQNTAATPTLGSVENSLLKPPT